MGSDKERKATDYAAMSSFLLGQAFGALCKIRLHLITMTDTQGVQLIEDDYLELKEKIDILYSGRNKESV